MVLKETPLNPHLGANNYDRLVCFLENFHDKIHVSNDVQHNSFFTLHKYMIAYKHEQL